MRFPDDLILKPSLKDNYFDLRGLSVYSALSVSSLRMQIKNGLPCYLLKGKFLIRRSEFDQWISRYRQNRGRDLDRLVDEVVREIG